MSDPLDASTAGLGAAAMAAFGLAYKFWRLVKGDNRGDKAADDMTARIKELEARVDKFAGERNTAVVEAAKYEERNRHLVAEIQRLEAENAELRKRIKH